MPRQLADWSALELAHGVRAWLEVLNGSRPLPMSRKVASTAVHVGGAGGAVPLAVVPTRAMRV